MTALLGGILPACVYDDEDTTSGPEQRDGFNISVAISAGNAPTARAYTGDLPDEGGAGAENYIDINDLQIYAFSTDDSNTLLAQIYPNSNPEGITPPEVTPVGNTYYLKAELPYDTFSNNKEFKLVAVANGGATSLDADLDWETLTTQTYSMDYENNQAWIPQWGKTGSGIPMFGVQKVTIVGYNFKTYNEFNPYLLEDINMLRALAKVEVVDALENVADEETVVSVGLSSYNTKGYLTTDCDDVTTTENVMVARIPDDRNLSTTPLSFAREGSKFTAYLPEYELGNADSRKVIVVEIQKKENEEIMTGRFELFLAPYTAEGRPETDEAKLNEYPWQALLRNHIYRYKITQVNWTEPVQGTVSYMVCPWENQSGEIEFD